MMQLQTIWVGVEMQDGGDTRFKEKQGMVVKVRSWPQSLWSTYIVLREPLFTFDGANQDRMAILGLHRCCGDVWGLPKFFYIHLGKSKVAAGVPGWVFFKRRSRSKEPLCCNTHRVGHRAKHSRDADAKNCLPGAFKGSNDAALLYACCPYGSTEVIDPSGYGS